MKKITLDPKNIGRGNLILVNREHPLRQEPPQAALLPVRFDYPNILMDRQAATMLSTVFTVLDCSARIVPVSGYRTLEEQVALYQDSLRENGEAFTKQFVAAPNCSEHQTGLAIDLAENRPDIDFICPAFPYEGVCQRFRERAVDYGFIERYPEGREAETGIAPEPWHFRYVGAPHADLMRELDLTLEGYITYLKDFSYEKKHLRREVMGRDMEIFYVPLAGPGPITVELPEKMPFQVSGNNVDGMIVTGWRQKA